MWYHAQSHKATIRFLSINILHKVLNRAQADVAVGSNSSVMKAAAIVLVFYNDLCLRLVKVNNGP